MTDRPIASGVSFSPGARRLTHISRRAALGFWIFASAAVWIGIVGVAVALL